jgi:alginate O-acetyltransferase complex protein AlgI
MAVCSLGFLFFCGAAVIVFHLAPGKRSRQILLACVSLTFLIPLVPDLRSWIWFASMLGVTYGALALVRARGRGGIVAACVSLVLLLYLYVKRYTLLSSFIPFPLAMDMRLHKVELVGLSYMTFKFIHMLIDQWQGQLAPFNLWRYLNYQLSFFTITAGPIQRYNNFLKYWEEMDLQPSEARESLLYWIRILTGMIKVGLLGTSIESAINNYGGLWTTPTFASVLIAFYAYPVYLYFNFSGYTDIMIGAGGLLGFRLPENFNRPWLSRNVLDFWDRWHITLTHWIRDYVFMSSYKAAATAFPRGARSWSYSLLFFALFVAGVWHGTTDGFVIFGLLNGLGAAVTRAYGDILRATIGHHRLRAYLKNKAIRLVAIVITLHYVCVCELFFANDVDRAMRILRALGTCLVHLPAAVSSYSWQGPALVLAAAAVLLAALWKSDATGAFVERVGRWLAERNGLLSTILCAQCAFVAGMFFVQWAFQQEPPPVLYMQF